MTGGPGDRPDRWGHYAGFVSRFVAYVIDLGATTGVFMLALAAASFAASVVTGDTIHWSKGAPAVIAVYAVWEFVYFAYSWAANGKTFGMAALGVQVVGTEGDALDARRAVVRTLAFPLSFLLCGLGFVGILTGRERRALHDVIAGTVVVYVWDAHAAHLRFLARGSESIPAESVPAGSIPAAVTDPNSRLARRDPPQQLVHDPCREARLRGCGVVLAPGHHRASEGEHGDLDVGVGAELAGGDAAAQHRPDEFPARLHDLLLVAGHQPGIPLPLAVQQGELPRVPGIVRVPRHDIEHRDQVRPYRLAARLRQRRLEGGERRDEQVLLARPAPVERGLAYPGAGRDVLAAHPVDSALADGLERGVEDRLLGPLTAWPPRTPRGVLGGGGRAACHVGVDVAGFRAHVGLPLR